jgi:hypothetical protein
LYRNQGINASFLAFSSSQLGHFVSRMDWMACREETVENIV